MYRGGIALFWKKNDFFSSFFVYDFYFMLQLFSNDFIIKIQFSISVSQLFKWCRCFHFLFQCILAYDVQASLYKRRKWLKINTTVFDGCTTYVHYKVMWIVLFFYLLWWKTETNFQLDVFSDDVWWTERTLMQFISFVCFMHQQCNYLFWCIFSMQMIWLFISMILLWSR